MPEDIEESLETNFVIARDIVIMEIRDRRSWKILEDHDSGSVQVFRGCLLSLFLQLLSTYSTHPTSSMCLSRLNLDPTGLLGF